MAGKIPEGTKSDLVLALSDMPASDRADAAFGILSSMVWQSGRDEEYEAITDRLAPIYQRIGEMMEEEGICSGLGWVALVMWLLTALIGYFKDREMSEGESVN